MKSFKEIFNESKEYKDKNIFRFVRYGDLDRNKKQQNYVDNKKTDPLNSGDEISYHLAPVSRGFYAFPLDKQEPFLLGSLDKTQPENFKNFPEEYSNEMTDEESDNFFNKMNIYYKNQKHKNKKVFTLDKDDLIWHHLEEWIPNNEIEQRKGSWILTTVKTFDRAKKKSYQKCKGRNPALFDIGIGEPMGKRGVMFSQGDHLEVFVPSKSLKN